jgi:hypothetical protein
MRPQFTLKSMLWLTAVVATFFAGSYVGPYQSFSWWRERHRRKDIEAAEADVKAKVARAKAMEKEARSQREKKGSPKQ